MKKKSFRLLIGLFSALLAFLIVSPVLAETLSPQVVATGLTNVVLDAGSTSASDNISRHIANYSFNPTSTGRDFITGGQ